MRRKERKHTFRGLGVLWPLRPAGDGRSGPRPPSARVLEQAERIRSWRRGAEVAFEKIHRGEKETDVSIVLTADHKCTLHTFTGMTGRARGTRSAGHMPAMRPTRCPAQPAPPGTSPLKISGKRRHPCHPVLRLCHTRAPTAAPEPTGINAKTNQL